MRGFGGREIDEATVREMDEVARAVQYGSVPDLEQAERLLGLATEARRVARDELYDAQAAKGRAMREPHRAISHGQHPALAFEMARRDVSEANWQSQLFDWRYRMLQRGCEMARHVLTEQTAEPDLLKPDLTS